MQAFVWLVPLGERVLFSGCGGGVFLLLFCIELWFEGFFILLVIWGFFVFVFLVGSSVGFFFFVVVVVVLFCFYLPGIHNIPCT